VCIYPPSVYLYLEPNDVEASKFDVVINVAREVVNPFELAAQKAAPKYRDMGVQVNMFPGQTADPNPQPALDSTVLKITDEYVDAPETPKAAKSDPEYIHKPWDHNTPVAVELLELCQLVEDRVKKGKKVLIHCQCGVSRSACLIIAYGLYQNPSLSVLEAYDAAKERSRWINPNMFFMYELNDFKNILLQKMPTKIARAAAPRPGPKMGLTRTQSDSVIPSILPTSFSPMTPLQDEPASAPLEHEGEILDQQPAEPASPAFVGQDSVQATEIPLPPISPSDPSTSEEAPSLRAASALKPLPLKAKPSLTINTPSPPLPSVTRPNDTLLPTIEPTLNLPQLRPTTFSPPPQRTLRPMPSLPAGFSSSLLSRRISPIPALPTPTMTPTLSFPALRPAHISVNPIGHPPLIALTQATPLTGTLHEHIAAPLELMSPRAMEFTASPFHRHAAGDVMSPVGAGPGLGFWDRLVARQKSEGRTAEDGKGRERKVELPDPRSPANVGGAPIVRSIDEVL
jgi:tyrosine-protein phosphatase